MNVQLKGFHIILLAHVLTIVFLLAGCGGEGGAEDDTDTLPSTDGDTDSDTDIDTDVDSDTDSDTEKLPLSSTLLATGSFHTCALTDSGAVKCWGNNEDGQLGDGTTTNTHTPTDVTGLSSGVVAVAAGGSHTCALTDSGAVKCWGNNEDGQLGDGTTTERHTPTDVTGLSSDVVAVASGWHHTCAITDIGAIKCWGNNYSGQLGDGTTTDRHIPTDVTGLSSGLVAVAAGGSHTCALTDSGAVKCWGHNGDGQIGDGTTTERPTPAEVTSLSAGVVAVAAGGSHTCALTDSGAVKCWGNNYSGQLGDGTYTDRHTPTDVTGLSSGVVAVAAGRFHSCALADSGAVKCWGSNGSGQLGDGTTTERLTPTDVTSLPSGAVAVAAGRSHTCALTDGGAVKCWGYNGDGQLGDGTAMERSTPADVTGLSSGVLAVATGSFHTCALTDSGAVKCWGNNGHCQLGNGTTANSITPTDVTGLSSGVVAVAAGGSHTCALTDSGAVKCWGRNNSGQIGDGTYTERPTPKDVTGLSSGVLAVATGSFHTCALTDSGAVKCWGYNYYGQLGNGTSTSSYSPTDVTGLSSGAVAVAARTSHTCALTDSGAVKCWGNNYWGQLGDSTFTDRHTPTDVTGLSSGVVAMVTGSSHTCALTDSGAVKCWGGGGHCQLGNGTTANSITPTDVTGLSSGVVAVAAGGSHTCALTDSGAVKCWGLNNVGQLGDGTYKQWLFPTDVTGLSSGVVAVAAGGSHTCALTDSGAVKCWGDNEDGQLGDGYGVTPVDVINFP